MNAGNFCKTSSTVRCKVEMPTARTILPKLLHAINHTFIGAGDWLVSFVQKFRENGKVLHRIFRSVRVGLNIDDVFRWMPGKILFKSDPGTGQDPATPIETGNGSAENMTGERKRCDITTGRTSMSVQIDSLTLTPDENPVVRSGMLKQVSSSLRWNASRSKSGPVAD